MERILKSLIFLVFVFLAISCSDEIPDKVEDSSKEIVEDSLIEVVEDSPKVEAQKYFPLNIGDKFVFDMQRSFWCADVHDGRESVFYKKHMEIIKDTLIESKQYFVAKVYQDIYEWEYFDWTYDSSFHYKDTSIIRSLNTEYYRISDDGILHTKKRWDSSIDSSYSFNLDATEVDTLYNEYPNWDINKNYGYDYFRFFGLKEVGKDTVFGKVLDKKVYMRTDFVGFKEIVTFTEGLGLVSRYNYFCGPNRVDLEEAYINGTKYSE